MFILETLSSVVNVFHYYFKLYGFSSKDSNIMLHYPPYKNWQRNCMEIIFFFFFFEIVSSPRTMAPSLHRSICRQPTHGHSCWQTAQYTVLNAERVRHTPKPFWAWGREWERSQWKWLWRGWRGRKGEQPYEISK